jgi:hypothetical protein
MVEENSKATILGTISTLTILLGLACYFIVGLVILGSIAIICGGGLAIGIKLRYYVIRGRRLRFKLE